MAKLGKYSNEKTVLRVFGDRVRELRNKSGKSVYDVTGDDMPIKSRQHWQAIENGHKNINLTTVFKIAKTLQVDPKSLF